MAYYSRNHKKLKSNHMKYLDCGGCANIFFDQKIILKEYYPSTPPSQRLSTKMFDLLKEIDHPHLVKLLEIYHYCDLEQLVKSMLGIMPFIADAYTAKFYSEDKENILHRHKDYLLDNLRELELLFQLFTINQICTNDVKRANTILTEESIVIIDPDLFLFSQDSQKELSILNKKNLLYLLKDICLKSLKGVSLRDYQKISAFLSNELATTFVDEDTDISYEMSKRLKYVKKPIEYLIENVH